MADNFYGEVLTDHNLHPLHKRGLSCATCSHRGVNPSCGDDITLELEVRDGVIKNGSFTGSGCAVSQASADIMLELIIGRTVEDAKHYNDLFMKMIEGNISEAELEELEEAGALQSVSKMPARVKCAVLGWRTLDALLGQDGSKGEQ